MGAVSRNGGTGAITGGRAKRDGSRRARASERALRETRRGVAAADAGDCSAMESLDRRLGVVATRRFGAPHAHAAWQLFRWVVLRITGPGANVSRWWVADRIGVKPTTLEDWVKPGGRNTPTLAAFARLLGVTPADVAMEALDAFAGLYGLKAVQRRADPGGPDLARLALDLSGLDGDLARAVVEATTPGGDGGSAITDAERRRVLTAAKRLRRKADEMEAAVEGGGSW